MAEIIQLIINGTVYPHSTGDKYRAYPRDEGKITPMISGRKVKEVKFRPWVIEYSYDYPDSFNDGLMRTCLADLRSDKPVLVDFLVPESGERLTSTFFCIEDPKPFYAFESGGIARWHNIHFVLLEEEPSYGRR